MSRLLLVLAHPDDESMGNGTLIARHVAAGCEVSLVCATKGGAGWNGRPAGARPEELTAIRAKELSRAAATLGLAHVDLWDYPDGGVPGCDQAEITERIRAAIDRAQPDVVVGWGPDGAYGHPDHIAVGACTDAALAGSALPHYHMAVDQAMADGLLGAFRAAGIDAGGMQVRPVDRLDAAFEPTAEELALVRRAIECHDSQLNPMYQAILVDDPTLFWLARSCYVRVSGPLPEPATELLPELRQ